MTEPKKSLFKTGIIHEDGTLTPQGAELFGQFIFDKFANEFYDEVVKKIKKSMEEDSE